MECATPCKGQRRTQDVGASSSNTPIQPTIKAATKLQSIVHDNKEMYDFEDTIGKRNDEKSGKSPNRSKKKRKQRRR